MRGGRGEAACLGVSRLGRAHGMGGRPRGHVRSHVLKGGQVTKGQGKGSQVTKGQGKHAHLKDGQVAEVSDIEVPQVALQPRAKVGDMKGPE